MAGVERVGDLEIGRDLEFQHWEWAIQRVAWVVMTLVLVAGLGGLLGSGPLSDTSAESGPLTLEYGRFERRHAPEELEVAIDAGAASDGAVELWLPSDYVETIEIERIVPEPESERQAADRIVYAFAIDDPSSVTTVVFDFEHDTVGSKSGEIGVVDGSSIAFQQFVYP